MSTQFISPHIFSLVKKVLQCNVLTLTQFFNYQSIILNNLQKTWNQPTVLATQAWFHALQSSKMCQTANNSVSTYISMILAWRKSLLKLLILHLQPLFTGIVQPKIKCSPFTHSCHCLLWNTNKDISKKVSVVFETFFYFILCFTEQK